METKALIPMKCIEKIHVSSENTKLEDELFKAARSEIRSLSTYLKVGDVETVLFANAFAMWFDTETFTKVFKYFGLKEFQILNYRKELNNLYSKGLLINQDKWGKKINEFTISQTVLAAVSENTEIIYDSIPEKNTLPTLVELLEEFDNASDQFDDKTIYFHEFRAIIRNLLKEHEHIALFKEIKKYQLDNFETYFLLDTIWDAIKLGDNDFNTGVQVTVNDYYKQKYESLPVITKIVQGESKLTKKDLIVLSKEQFANRSSAKLSDKMIDFLRGHEGLNIDNISKDNAKLISAKQLPERKLFYNEDESRQVESLISVLQSEKFVELQNILKEKNMPFGIAALFHGEAGTGKTETVYQIAKETGRNVFKVDISETKSKWFGESQKLIKGIFDDYRGFCKTEKQTPILLFNEADAVIGKRKPAGSTNVADTENAIQNIILEEMENFEGILFATTNLTENMDSAFERRFLFKIKFNKPSTENSAKIWKLKLPFLTENDCITLAEKFKFSGGEMENIARKSTMHEILNGTKPTYRLIEEMCSSEKWSDEGTKRRIGF